MADLDLLLAQVDGVHDDILALEQELVRIPTVNTGFMPTGDESRVCEFVQEWLAEDSVEVEVLEAAPNRGNLISRLEGRSGQAGLDVHVAYRRCACGRRGQVALSTL